MYSSIMGKYWSDSFSSYYNKTIRIDFSNRCVDLENRIFILQIWDTAGDPKFREIIRSYFKSQMAVIIVFDVTININYK